MPGGRGSFSEVSLVMLLIVITGREFTQCAHKKNRLKKMFCDWQLAAAQPQGGENKEAHGPTTQKSACGEQCKTTRRAYVSKQLRTSPKQPEAVSNEE